MTSMFPCVNVERAINRVSDRAQNSIARQAMTETVVNNDTSALTQLAGVRVAKFQAGTLMSVTLQMNLSCHKTSCDIYAAGYSTSPLTLRECSFMFVSGIEIIRHVYQNILLLFDGRTTVQEPKCSCIPFCRQTFIKGDKYV